jgi:hypothetical protein
VTERRPPRWASSPENGAVSFQEARRGLPPTFEAWAAVKTVCLDVSGPGFEPLETKFSRSSVAALDSVALSRTRACAVDRRRPRVRSRCLFARPPRPLACAGIPVPPEFSLRVGCGGGEPQKAVKIGATPSGFLWRAWRRGSETLGACLPCACPSGNDQTIAIVTGDDRLLTSSVNPRKTFTQRFESHRPFAGNRWLAIRSTRASPTLRLRLVLPTHP